jgi:hypothetical protein
MAENDQPDGRQSLLAYLERHWRELSLRDARMLCVELVDVRGDGSRMIKETLTCS